VALPLTESREIYRRRLLILGRSEVLEEARATAELGVHELLFARNATEAAEQLGGLRADLVVCPSRLDGQSGIVLCRALDAGVEGAAQVVMLADTDEEERAATQAGCQAVLRDAAPWAVIETLGDLLRQLPPPAGQRSLQVEVETGGKTWSCQAGSLSTTAVQAFLPVVLAEGTAVRLTLLHRDRRIVSLDATVAQTAPDRSSPGLTATRLDLSSLVGPQHGLARALLRRMIQSWAQSPAIVTRDDEQVDWLLSDLLPGLSYGESPEELPLELHRRQKLLLGESAAPAASSSASPGTGTASPEAASGLPATGERPPAPATSPSADLVARYTLDRKVADLRFGPAYAVTHQQLKKSALLFTTPAGFEASDVERYLADLRAAARVDHGALLKPWDVGRSGDGAAYAVYLAAWRPLASLVGRAGGVSAWTATRFARVLAEALAAVHERGVVHGALAPDTVLLERLPQGEELPRLFGFGAAGLLAAARQAPTLPGYLAPELKQGQSVSSRGDVFALGAVLFALCTGRDPGSIAAPDDPKAPRLPAPSKAAPGPGIAALDEAVEAATQPDPARRPTMSELGALLDRARSELVKQGAHDPMVGTVLAGRYRILARISSEPLGVLYRAQHVALGTRVTLKVLPEALRAEPVLATRFVNEARAASTIGHPAILEVYEVGELGEPGRTQSYFVTEELRGKRLSDILRTDGRIELGRALKLARHIAEALQAAHRCLIVHRDVQPSAVQVFDAGAAGGGEQVKILNFGLAKVLNGDEAQRLTRLGVAVGTPGYMAPEQARGQSVDARADLYGLGVLLFEMISGGLPFPRPALEALHRQAVETPPLLSSRVPSVPKFVDNLLARALARDPEERFQSASEMMAALDLARTQLQSTSLSSGAVEMPSLKLVAVASAPAPVVIPAASPPPQPAVPAAKEPAPDDMPKVMVDTSLGPVVTLDPPAATPAPRRAGGPSAADDDGPVRLSRRRWPVAVLGLAVLAGAAVVVMQFLGPPGRGAGAAVGSAQQQALAPARGAGDDRGAADDATAVQTTATPPAPSPSPSPPAPAATADGSAETADGAAEITPEMAAAGIEQELRNLTGRARRQLKRRDWRGALYTLERARQLGDTGTVRSLMAEAHRGLGHLKEAIQNQQLAIRREPHKIEHHLQLSRLHVGAGDVPGACRSLSTIYKRTRGNPQVREQLARYGCPEP
jgi:serine/threonine protein kinase